MDSRKEEEIEEITSESEMTNQRPTVEPNKEEKSSTRETSVEIERETLRIDINKIEVTEFSSLLGKLGMWRVSVPRWCRFFCGDASWALHVRVYQVWSGKNVFFFRGRMICGPDPRGFILTMLSIIISEWIFANYISDFSPIISSIISSISVILTILVIVNLFLVGTRDPGIIPRNKEKDPRETGITNTGNGSRRINIDGMEIQFKYCKICDLFRPPRSSHCAVCDNCVEKFDHHCPWIGTCIGLRNYRYYLMFIFSTFVFFLYIFIISSWRIITKMNKINKGFFALIVYVPEIFSLAVFSVMAVWFLGGLLVYHTHLISLNQTCHERFKQKYIFSSNPYDKGAMRNIKEVLFAKLPASRVNFRAIVEPNWSSTGKTSVNSPKRDEDEEEMHVIIQKESCKGPSGEIKK